MTTQIQTAAHLSSPQRTTEWHIRDKYIQLRRQLHPNYNPSPASEDQWARAAIVVEQLKADPRIFVEAQFEYHPCAYPHPNNLYGWSAVDRYRKYIEHFASLAEEVHAQQGAYLRNYIYKMGRTIDDTVLDPQSQLRPYFRLLVCSEAILAQVVERFGRQAITELTQNTDLLEFLKRDPQYDDRIKKYIVRQELPGGDDRASFTVPAPARSPLRG
jgi:hypothetical protein